MVRTTRSNNGLVGRNPNGQFAKGNKLSRGNKSHWNEKAQQLKRALTDAITEKDIKDIAKGLIKKAKNGDAQAAREIFNRIWGRATQQLEIEKVVESREISIEELREIMKEKTFPNWEDAIPK